MKNSLLILIVLLISGISFTQSYENLVPLKDVSQKVYFSKGAENRADKIVENFAEADTFFQNKFKVKADYTLLILNPMDWKTYAHPNAIYGIPHFLPDGRLVIAAENNDFWRRNMPPLEPLLKDISDQIGKIYTDETQRCLFALQNFLGGYARRFVHPNFHTQNF
ncbi:hypothetical protein [Moheibacter sediminis]|uniref:Uncharacterized protein n=1 Tax=Moheibacter sediminis TaxID=1434700 RepID=A0A1W2A788_9FLAO|nr:hypothetical protein [Moheibacter sediminis]SMC56575.1 hypothetical protein SAMN06296427_1047 [Moheibacter sediminis]